MGLAVEQLTSVRSPLPHSPGGVTERKNSLRWRILLVTRRRLPKVPPPGRKGGQGGPPLPERRGTRSSGARKYTTVEDLAHYSVDCRRGGQGVAERQNSLRRGMSLGYSERSRKNRSICGFRCLPSMISGRAMIRLPCHCRRIYRFTSIRICIFHKLSVCGDASGYGPSCDLILGEVCHHKAALAKGQSRGGA